MTRRLWVFAAVLAVAGLILALALVTARNADRDRQARAAAGKQRRTAAKQRFVLYEMLQPVALRNCELQRFGEPHDGGYLMCANLLGDIHAGYSYGISGYDQWGCDVATKFSVPVHQYDCFNTTVPVCPGGKTVFHAECVADKTETVEGRLFDTIKNQFSKNGDSGKRIVLKIDVEGAEWNSLVSAPDEVLQQLDQLVVEFHWKHDGKLNWSDPDPYIRVIQRLKQFFEVAHIHHNNAACAAGLEPFPAWAYEVLFVSKRLAVVDPSGTATVPHRFDAPNNPQVADCQPSPVGGSR